MSTPHKHSEGFLALVDDAKSRIRQIDAAGYQKIAQDRHLLIDVREDHEWEAGHAAGAVHMSKGTIERDIEMAVPDKAATMVLYCGEDSGPRSQRTHLRRCGYSNVISLDGGWRAWIAAGLPVEKP